jgi:DNA-binding NarL/FixJ family response regulator
VVCVDDHAVLVHGLQSQFEIDGKIEIVGRLESASRLVEEVQRLNADAVLLDIELPGPDAFEMASRLHQVLPAVRIIVLSAHIRDAFISASFAAGASGYFSKSDDLDEIVNGIHNVMRSRTGNFVLGSKVRERCRPIPQAKSRRRGAPANEAPSSVFRTGAPMTLMSTLTSREIEILRLIGKGLSRIQIATHLCRSVKTVDGHQDRIMKKLGIAARADLMRFSIREGLAQA